MATIDEKDEYAAAEQGGLRHLAPSRSNTAGSLLDGSDQLHRGMKSRHIQFMALGGA